MTDYEVTIAIPVYNVERYIRLTLDSALAQTFPSIEILVCDDCGTDGSIDIVRQYQQEHPRGKDIRIVSQPRNMGIGAARNRMIDEARGRYFFSLDADDSIAPNAIELLYGAVRQHGAQLVYGSYERVFTENDVEQQRVQYPYEHRVFTAPDEYACYAYDGKVQVMNWNFLIDIDVLRSNHLRVTPVGHGYGEDFTFTVDLPTYVQRVVLLHDITYQYYIRDASKPKRHKVLSREQIERSIAAIDRKKRRTELKARPYYAKRCSVLLMYDYSFVCQIIARRSEPVPPFTRREIRDVMWHPMSFSEIILSQQVRGKNLMFWLFAVLPPLLSVPLMTLFAKATHRI